MSARSYQPKPKAWEYPEGSAIARLNGAGCLTWQGQRWFVCEALAEQPVRIERVAKVLLVSYRHMYVREIDLGQGCTRPLVLPREERT